jgi:hypothetical protein
MLYALIESGEYWIGVPAELYAKTNQLFACAAGVTDVSNNETCVLL